MYSFIPIDCHDEKFQDREYPILEYIPAIKQKKVKPILKSPDESVITLDEVKMSSNFMSKFKDYIHKCQNRACIELAKENKQLRDYNCKLLNESEVLSQRLFEEANKMVSQERKTVCELKKENERLRQIISSLQK
ncbi:hypothetical protein HDV06_001322 [Boothiomyces sp. JEL0866]|nr:hypothetical protein HDV06_001322 [Boothiomyces sp. JEL0866]